jgi:hypothetical protein
MTNKVENRAGRAQEGEAIFHPMELSLWDVRQEAKQRAMDGSPAWLFRVKHEVQYDPHTLNQLLWDPKQLQELEESLGEKIIGVENGALNCAALWDGENEEGILIHKEGDELICAYLPLMSKAEAEKEHALSMKLAALASEADDVPIRIDRKIEAGRWSLKRLLHYLSEQIDV